MKKTLAILLAMAMIFALAACGGSNGGSQAETPTAAPEANTPAEEPSGSAPAEEAPPAGNEAPLKILFTQTHNDNSFMAYLAQTLVATAADRGIECVHLTCGSDEAVQNYNVRIS